MKTYKVVFGLLLLVNFVNGQTVQEKLDKAVKIFQADEQLKHALVSLYVVETNTGKPVYNLNSEVGLAPTSTQKIFTSIAAFELLGEKYKYTTEIGYDGNIENHVLNGNLYIVGHGDPTLGSWRYPQTKRALVLQKIGNAISNAGISSIKGDVVLNTSKFNYQPLPGGWIWDDIGNYYGAGTWGINWNENQYDLLLQPGNKEGDSVKIIGTEPGLQAYTLTNLLKTGKPGSGDNGYIYLPPYSPIGFVNGTVPAGEKRFTLSGSFPNPPYQLGAELEKYFTDNKIEVAGKFKTSDEFINNIQPVPSYKILIDSIVSPALDSIVYWFLQKSINLYGEALVKTIAYKNAGLGSTEKGVDLVKQFWAARGIDKDALNIMDGSGLSPQNRVTTNAMVTALQYAKDKSWYNSFYAALPLYNGIKMKSGSIGGARAYAGYVTSKSGTQYTFAVIVNNYSGSATAVVRKLYKVLDELK